VSEDEYLLRRQEEVRAVGRVFTAIAEEGGDAAERVGDTRDQSDAVAKAIAGTGTGTDGRAGGARKTGVMGAAVVGAFCERLPGEQGGDRDGVGWWGVAGGVGQIREAEAVPARRGPVADRGEEVRAAGRKGDAEDAVGGGRLVVLAHPAAQQVLHGGCLGGDIRVGMVQEVGDRAGVQPLGGRRPAPLRRDR
jgi:hypothetical protein